MTDEQKADLAVLERLLIPGFSLTAVGRDAVARIHALLSARLADPVQPAAGEGGLREALEPLAKLSSDAEWDDVADNARADVVYRSEAGGEESVGTISFVDFRRARAALSTSVPAGVVGIKPLEWSLEEGGEYIAQSAVGWFHIGRPANAWNLTMPSGDVPSFDTLLAAMAAAQADYDTCIRACLITPPAQEPTR